MGSWSYAYGANGNVVSRWDNRVWFTQEWNSSTGWTNYRQRWGGVAELLVRSLPVGHAVWFGAAR
ncbi:MAG: hypothetical protein KatS3mg053_4019 [Candidatus Roseilinea sp.]|nr:MAG: hypothetical protein KatS3mg053_4019 [Candidatus Roseilinea sp.]